MLCKTATNTSNTIRNVNKYEHLTAALHKACCAGHYVLCRKVTFYTVVWANKERKKERKKRKRNGALSDIVTWNILRHNCSMFKYSMTKSSQHVLRVECSFPYRHISRETQFPALSRNWFCVRQTVWKWTRKGALRPLYAVIGALDIVFGAEYRLFVTYLLHWESLRKLSR